MRLRQCLSNAALLSTAVTEYDENLIGDDLPLSEVIRRYGELETPGKVDRILSMISELRQCSEKIVVWSNFVGTLKLLQELAFRDLVTGCG